MRIPPPDPPAVAAPSQHLAQAGEIVGSATVRVGADDVGSIVERGEPVAVRPHERHDGLRRTSCAGWCRPGRRRPTGRAARALNVVLPAGVPVAVTVAAGVVATTV